MHTSTLEIEGGIGTKVPRSTVFVPRARHQRARSGRACSGAGSGLQSGPAGRSEYKPLRSQNDNFGGEGGLAEAAARARPRPRRPRITSKLRCDQLQGFGFSNPPREHRPVGNIDFASVACRRELRTRQSWDCPTSLKHRHGCSPAELKRASCLGPCCICDQSGYVERSVTT